MSKPGGGLKTAPRRGDDFQTVARRHPRPVSSDMPKRSRTPSVDRFGRHGRRHAIGHCEGDIASQQSSNGSNVIQMHGLRCAQVERDLSGSRTFWRKYHCVYLRRLGVRPDVSPSRESPVRRGPEQRSLSEHWREGWRPARRRSILRNSPATLELTSSDGGRPVRGSQDLARRRPRIDVEGDPMCCRARRHATVLPSGPQEFALNEWHRSLRTKMGLRPEAIANSAEESWNAVRRQRQAEPDLKRCRNRTRITW